MCVVMCKIVDKENSDEKLFVTDEEKIQFALWDKFEILGTKVKDIMI